MNKISFLKDLGTIEREETYSSFEELADLICQGRWSPGTFLEAKRTIKTFCSLDLLVLDIDGGCSLEEARDIFKDYRHLIGTTRNHQKEKNGVVCDRMRVVLALDYPITTDKNFKETFKAAQKLWPFIDPACKDVSRYFEPCIEIMYGDDLGRSFMAQAYVEPIKPVVITVEPGDFVKGNLSRHTLNFLMHGAKVGEAHGAMVKAFFDFKEQGYSKEEVIRELNLMVERLDDEKYVDRHALATVDDCFKRDTQLPLRPMYQGEPGDNLRIEAEDPKIISAKDLLTETFDYLNNKELIAGTPTGLEGLDKMLGGGFREGELTVLMASAKSGKNTLYHYLMHGMLSKGIKIGYASRELSPATEVIPNLLTIELQKNVWTSDITPELQAHARDIVSKWPLYFAPGYGFFEIDAMRHWCSLLSELGVQQVFFDHLHFLIEDENPQVIASTIREIKTLAKIYKMHINLIVQPKQLAEGQPLGLYTLRGGAAIGQALDNLIIMDRVRNPNTPNVAKLKLDVARHKLANPGHIFIQYDSSTTTFSEVEEAPQEITSQQIEHAGSIARNAVGNLGLLRLPETI